MTIGSSLRTAGLAARAAAIAGLALALGACSQSSELFVGGPTAPAGAPPQVAAGAEPSRSDLEKATEYWGKEHAKLPRDANAALNYARNLKALDRKREALGVLQSSYLYNAQNREFLSEFGRLALEEGHAPMAQQLLERADDPANPDWRVLSARGVVLAKQGQYKAAIPHFERARGLAPEQASIMSNLALAYTMDGQAAKAEPMLRQANASQTSDPRVRQNLALVLRLQGKGDEATRVSMGTDQPTLVPAPPVSVAARPQPEPSPAFVTSTSLPVRTASVRKATSAAPASADPDALIRAAIEADVAREQTRSRAIATSSAPQR